MPRARAQPFTATHCPPARSSQGKDPSDREARAENRGQKRGWWRYGSRVGRLGSRGRRLAAAAQRLLKAPLPSLAPGARLPIHLSLCPSDRSGKGTAGSPRGRTVSPPKLPPQCDCARPGLPHTLPGTRCGACLPSPQAPRCAPGRNFPRQRGMAHRPTGSARLPGFRASERRRQLCLLLHLLFSSCNDSQALHRRGLAAAQHCELR